MCGRSYRCYVTFDDVSNGQGKGERQNIHITRCRGVRSCTHAGRDSRASTVIVPELDHDDVICDNRVDDVLDYHHKSHSCQCAFTHVDRKRKEHTVPIVSVTPRARSSDRIIHDRQTRAQVRTDLGAPADDGWVPVVRGHCRVTREVERRCAACS